MELGRSGRIDRINRISRYQWDQQNQQNQQNQQKPAEISRIDRISSKKKKWPCQCENNSRTSGISRNRQNLLRFMYIQILYYCMYIQYSTVCTGTYPQRPCFSPTKLSVSTYLHVPKVCIVCIVQYKYKYYLSTTGQS